MYMCKYEVLHNLRSVAPRREHSSCWLAHLVSLALLALLSLNRERRTQGEERGTSSEVLCSTEHSYEYGPLLCIKVAMYNSTSYCT